MKTVILHPSNKKELNFLLLLLERLKIPFDIPEEEKEVEPPVEDPINYLFGSWKSDESGTEMVERIYTDRNDTPREINL